MSLYTTRGWVDINIVRSNKVINNYIWMNMITYFVLSHFVEDYLQKRKNSGFQRKATKESNKNETCDHTNSTRLAMATIHKKELFTKMTIVAKVVVSDCSFLFRCVLWSFFKKVVVVVSDCSFLFRCVLWSFFKTLLSYWLTSELFWLRNW